MYLLFENGLQKKYSKICPVGADGETWHPAPEGFIPDSDICYLDNHQIRMATEIQKAAIEQIKNPEGLSFWQYKEALEEVFPGEAPLLDSFKSVLCKKIKQEREDFLGQGFAWFSSEHKEVFIFDASTSSVRSFADSYNSRQNNPKVKNTLEKVKFGQHERPDREFIPMDNKEFIAFYEALEEYNRRIQSAVAKKCQQIKFCESIAVLKEIEEIDFVYEVRNVPPGLVTITEKLKTALSPKTWLARLNAAMERQELNAENPLGF